MSVLRPSPSEAKLSQETKRPCHSRITACAHVRGACSSLLLGGGGASDRRSAFDREGKCSPRRDARGGCGRWSLARPRSRSLSCSSPRRSSSTRTARRKETAAPPLLRLRCCASLRLSRLMLASLAPSLGVFQRHALYQVVFVFGRRRPGRSAACRLLSAVARTQRTVGRPTARGPRGSNLSPADPDRGEKTACCLVLGAG